MAITVNLRYTGMNGAARAFAEEMTASGTVAAIRAEKGNLRYEYYLSFDDPETVLLIDAWADQESIDVHHASPMMATIAALREKYDLHMTVERYISLEENNEGEIISRETIEASIDSGEAYRILQDGLSVGGMVRCRAAAPGSE